MHDGSNGSDDTRRSKRVSIFPRSPVKPEEARWQVTKDEAPTHFFVRGSSPSLPPMESAAGYTQPLRSVSGPMSRPWLEPAPPNPHDKALSSVRPATWSDSSMEPAVMSVAPPGPATAPAAQSRFPQIAMLVATVGMLAVVAVGAIVRTTILADADEPSAAAAAEPPPPETSADGILTAATPPADTIFAKTSVHTAPAQIMADVGAELSDKPKDHPPATNGKGRKGPKSSHLTVHSAMKTEAKAETAAPADSKKNKTPRTGPPPAQPAQAESEIDLAKAAAQLADGQLGNSLR